jgi:hypothetical protein
MKGKFIKVGESYITKSAGDHYNEVVMTVLRIVNEEGMEVEESNALDSMVHWRSVKRIHNKINQTGRIWWFQEYCVQIVPQEVRKDRGL